MTPLRLIAAVARLWLAALALLVLVPSLASAQAFPKLTAVVVDDAGVLPEATKADLAAKLDALQRDTHRQLIVATIRDLQGYPLDDYGYRLGRAWGIGLKGVDNGAVLFIAPNNPAGQRGPRIEVGYGLEPVLTDALSSVIINRDMMPRLRDNGDVAGALTAGTDALIAQLRASPDEAKARTDAAIVEFDRAHRRARGSGGGVPIGLIFWGIVMAFVLLSMVRRGGGRGQRYRGDSGGVMPVVLWSIANEIGRGAFRGGGGGSWGSGGGDGGGWGGGGFTGGGGGSGGGGGASGSW